MLLVVLLGCGEGVICSVEPVAPTVQLWTDAPRSVGEARTVTVQVDRSAGQGVTSVSVLGVALAVKDGAWTGTLSADRLEAAARALDPDAEDVTVPLEVEVCDVCGCNPVTDAGSLEVDLSDWTPTVAPTLTFITPDALDWIPASTTTTTLLTVSAGDVAAAGESVDLTITGGTFLGGAVTQSLVLDDTGASSVLIHAETAGRVNVVASLGTAQGEASILAVAAPTVTGPADPVAAGSSTVIAAMSDGGGLAGCTWLASDDDAVGVWFDGTEADGSVTFTSAPGTALLVVEALVAPAQLSVQCADLYGRVGSTTVTIGE